MASTELSDMTITELRSMANTFGIPIQSKMRKADLVATLSGAVEGAATAATQKAAADQAAAAAKQAEKDAAAAAKQAEKDAAAAAKAAKAAADKLAADQAAAATLTQIDEIESDARALTGETEINLGKLAADFLRLYPLAPWKVRGIGTDVAAITDYYTSLGVSSDDDTLSFPTVIRQAMCAAMWAGTAIEDKPALPGEAATEDTEAVPETAAIIIPTRVRDMIAFVMGAVDGADMPAIGPKVPVSHLVAMTGAATPTIARDRRALGLASETRAAAQPKPAPAGDGDGDGEGNGNGTGHTVDSLAGIVASIDDVSLLRDLATMVAARIATLTAGAESDAA